MVEVMSGGEVRGVARGGIARRRAGVGSWLGGVGGARGVDLAQGYG